MDSETRVGDRVKVETGDGMYVGILMPRPELTNQEHLVLKLDNGYNVGIEKKKVQKMSLIKRNGGRKEANGKGRTQEYDPAKPVVSVLSTGGTISSKIDYHTGGVYASYTAGDLLDAVPELGLLANVRSRFLMNVMSEDMNPGLWVKIAEAVAAEFNSGASGVVVTHGTDTMHYTSAALSFMLRGLGGPVVLTGSQRSSDRGSSDGFLNMLCSVILAKSDVSGVYLVMHGSMDDVFCLAHRGVKVRKMHTSRRDAFKSINDVPLSKIYPDGRIEFISGSYPKRSDSKVVVDSRLEGRVALVKVYPGMNPGLIDFHIDSGVQGIVFEGTALGHVPTTIKETSLLPKIERARDAGVVMAMTTQCLYGRVHPHVYSNLREVSTRGVVYCEDMLPETAYIKLMWVLGHTKNPSEAREMMLTNYVGELTERTGVGKEFGEM